MIFDTVISDDGFTFTLAGDADEWGVVGNRFYLVVVGFGDITFGAGVYGIKYDDRVPIKCLACI